MTGPPHLEVWLDSGSVRRFDLTGDRVTVGRSATSDVVLDDGQTSRVHAVLEQFAGAWVVRDVGSRNGTFVNGRAVDGQAGLRDGDELRVGRTVFVMRAPEEPTSEPTERVTLPPRITPRERDVLVELLRPNLAGGPFTDAATPRQIADQLSVTTGAVVYHLANLYEKFGIDVEPERRRGRLANEALRRGAVTLADLRTTAPT